jgi:signal transduction histidine kinase
MTSKLASPTEQGAVRSQHDAVASQADDWGERVAHELRGPAGVTLGAIDELELSLGANAEAHRALIAMARRGVGKVLRTAERLSRKSQLDAGRAVMAPTTIDLRTLVTRAREEAEQLESRRGIEVTVEANDGSWLMTVDESWAQVVLTEMISLSIRAARREVKIALTRDNDRPQVVVTDDGRPPAAQAQGGHASPADRRTACLSLPVAHGAARALGAELTMEAAAPGNRRTLQFGRELSGN